MMNNFIAESNIPSFNYFKWGGGKVRISFLFYDTNDKYYELSPKKSLIKRVRKCLERKD